MRKSNLTGVRGPRRRTGRCPGRTLPGLFSYLAHPDLVMRGYPEFDSACEDMADELCKTALEMGLPLEYNLMGNEYKRRTDLPWKGAGYPHDRFWRIAADWGCTAVIGLDSHRASHVLETGEYDDAVRYLKTLGIRRTQTIPMRRAETR